MFLFWVIYIDNSVRVFILNIIFNYLSSGVYLFGKIVIKMIFILLFVLIFIKFNFINEKIDSWLFF